MPQSAYGLIELIFVFGGVLSFLVWELVRTRRGMKAEKDRAAREKAEHDKAGR